MKCIFIKLFTVSLFLGLSTPLITAQTYKEYAREVREEVWNWDVPEFRNYNIPEEYDNESAVILAIHKQIQATGKPKLRVTPGLSFKINKELFYYITNRTLVKINDKVSQEAFSTISYEEEFKIDGNFINSKFKTIVGVRIIKPDGTIQEVDIDEEAVKVSTGKKDKGKLKKLAVPGLEVGDILDYFIQNEGHIDTQNMAPLEFSFGNTYPVLSYTVYCEVGGNLTVEYRSINGAPEMEVSTTNNKDHILMVQQKNIPKVDGYVRWSSPYRDIPMIRMSVLNNASKEIWKPKTARKKGIHENVPASVILDDAKCVPFWYLSTLEDLRTVRKINAYKKEHPELSDPELASFIYDLIQYNEGSPFTNSSAFFRTLSFFLKHFKIENKLGFVTSKYGARADELANRFDVHYFMLANDNQQIFTHNPPCFFAGEVLPDFEGETAVIYGKFKHKGNIIQGNESQFTFPVSSPSDNTSIIHIQACVAEDDPLVLDIKKNNSYTGSLKRGPQLTFLTKEQYEQEMRERLGISQSLLEEMEGSRRGRKYLEDYQEMIREQAKEQLQNFTDEVTLYHDNAPKEIIDYSVESLGMTSLNPDFKSNVHYKQEGLIQRAGSNYILNAGKLIGSQLDLKGNDRIRNMDVYLPTARLIEYAIEVQIPDGYRVENLDNLNKSMDNAAGSFSASATFANQLLTIQAQKVYKQAFLPVNEWNMLLEMLDSAIDFYSQSVVLTKL